MSTEEPDLRTMTDDELIRQLEIAVMKLDVYVRAAGLRGIRVSLDVVDDKQPAHPDGVSRVVHHAQVPEGGGIPPTVLDTSEAGQLLWIGRKVQVGDTHVVIILHTPEEPRTVKPDDPEALEKIQALLDEGAFPIGVAFMGGEVANLVEVGLSDEAENEEWLQPFVEELLATALECRTNLLEDPDWRPAPGSLLG